MTRDEAYTLGMKIREESGCDDYTGDLPELIADAIMAADRAAREECAKIAEAWLYKVNPDWVKGASAVASAIRASTGGKG